MKLHSVATLLTLSGLCFVQSGCGSAPRRIDPAANQGIITVHEIDFKDWQEAAVKSVTSLNQSHVLARPDGRKTILMIGELRNKTSNANLNTRLLTDKIRTEVLRGGKALTTTAVGASGAEDTATRQVRELENDDLFNAETVQKRGTVLAPDMSLSGELIQEKRAAGRTQESYFFIHLVLTDLATGLAVWEDSVEIAKQGKSGLFH